MAQTVSLKTLVSKVKTAAGVDAIEELLKFRLQEAREMYENANEPSELLRGRVLEIKDLLGLIGKRP